MNHDLEHMQNKLFKTLDPNSSYTNDDFWKEFGSPNLKSNISEDFDSYKIQLKFINTSDNPDPEYKTAGSSGFDIRANLKEPVTLYIGQRVLIDTGLSFDIPDNFEIQIRSRSGLAATNGVMVLNSPGTIDSDYTGELKIILINLGQDIFTINHGDRIAQAVVSSVMSKNVIKLTNVKEIIKQTDRNSGGFGSTGLK